VIASVAVWLVS